MKKLLCPTASPYLGQSAEAGASLQEKRALLGRHEVLAQRSGKRPEGAAQAGGVLGLQAHAAVSREAHGFPFGHGQARSHHPEVEQLKHRSLKWKTVGQRGQGAWG